MCVVLACGFRAARSRLDSLSVRVVRLAPFSVFAYTATSCKTNSAKKVALQVDGKAMGEESVVIAPATCGLIPLVGVAALLACGLLFARNRARSEGPLLNCSLLWLAVYVVVLAGAGFFCLSGLYVGAIWQLVVYSIALTVFGAVTQLPRRWRAAGFSPKKTCPISDHVRDLLVLLACTPLSVLALETPYNDWVWEFSDHLSSFTIEALLVLCLLSLLYFLAGRRGSGSAIGVVALAFVGVAQYFVYAFKVAAIMPSDLLVVGTALAVSGNYDYFIGGSVLFGIVYAGAALCLLSFVAPTKDAKKSGSALVRYASSFACALVIAVMMGYFVTVPDYAKDADVHVDSWFTYDSYKHNGFLTTFITVAQDMAVEKPANYSSEDTTNAVGQMAARYEELTLGDEGRQQAQAQFAEELPCVVAIMNESFCDMSVYEELHADYTGPKFFNGDIDGTVMRGSVLVSVNGGGTCNSEFEFLTGNTMAFFGMGMYPYSTYKFDDCPGLARQFDELGYTTIAIHPNYPTNWARDVIYEKMGFQRFLSMDDFPDADLVHNEVSDEATYDKILELLESDDSPQFIFDVTMQNHGGYSRGDIPEQFQTDYVPSDWGSEESIAVLNEYLGCMEASDVALEDFLEQLRQLDRPVVVVFFGDHQPGFSKDINEAFFEDDGSAEYVQRVYRTPYLVWANYDVAGAQRYTQEGETCTAYLSALFEDGVGVPMSDYQKAQLVASQTVPSINLYGFSDAEGNEYLFDDANLGASDGEASADSEQNAPQECLETIDLLERAQYQHFIDR